MASIYQTHRTSFFALLLLLTTLGCIHVLATEDSSVVNVTPVGLIRQGDSPPRTIKTPSSATSPVSEHEERKLGELGAGIAEPFISSPKKVDEVSSHLQKDGWIVKAVKRLYLDKGAKAAGREFANKVGVFLLPYLTRVVHSVAWVGDFIILLWRSLKAQYVKHV